MNLWLPNVECGILFVVCLEICYGQIVKSSRNTNSRQSSVTTYFGHEPYGPRTYVYGFEVNDNKTENRQFRDERRYLNGSVEGSYGYLRPDGRVTVTTFIADPKLGYQSETRTFEENSAEYENFWPTKSPKFLHHRTQGSDEWTTGNITYDENTKLNLNMGGLDENVTSALETEHGIEVNHIDVVNDLLSPPLLDIVNGKIPLEKSKTLPKQAQQLGFKTFQNVIPKQFPIVPFELLEKVSVQLKNDTEKMEVEKMMDKNGADLSLEDDNTGAPKSLQNSLESSLERQSHRISMIVNQTREEFLQNLPNLLSN